MRRLALSIASLSVALLLLSHPGMAATSTVYVTDEVGGLGHAGVTDGGEMWAIWEGNNELADADYLDITAGWLTLKNQKLTAGMEVLSDIDVEDGLPAGVKAIWYTWFVYVETGPEHWHEDYRLHVCWDGSSFYAFVADTRDFYNPPYEVTYLENLVVDGNTMEVRLDIDLLPDATAWFFESIVWMVVPVDEDMMTQTAWYWYCADITDWDPEESMLPWLPMP